MRLGRESLILIAVPLVVMALAFALFIPRESPGVKDSSTDVSAQLDVDRPASDRKFVELTPFDPASVVGAPADPNALPVDKRDVAASNSPAPKAPPLDDAGTQPSEKGAVSNGDGLPPADRDDSGQFKSPRSPRPEFRKPWSGGLRDEQGNPIPGGVVTVTERRNLFDSSGNSFEQVSVRERIAVGVEGTFEVPRRQGYVYVVNVAATGYAATSIPLSAQPSSVITLRRPLQVAGFVTNSLDQSPISGVSVAVVNESGRRELTTNTAGEYSFQGVSPGVFFLELSHPGYRSRRVVVRPVGQETLINRNIELTQGAEMTVSVIDGMTELPVVDELTISVFDRGRSLSAGQVVTNDGDVVKFDSLSAGGTYGVTVTSAAFGTAYKEVVAPSSGGDFAVSIQLNEPWTFRGLVVSENGLPVHMARITLNGPTATGDPSYVTFTDAEGFFALSGLGRQLTFRVTVFHPEHAVKILPVVSSALLVPDEVVTIAITRAARVQGIIRSANGAPIPGALVRLRSDALVGSLVPSVPSSPVGSEGLFAYTDDEGAFLITGVPEGSASLTAIAAGFVTGRAELSVVGLEEPVLAPEILLLSSQRSR